MTPIGREGSIGRGPLRRSQTQSPPSRTMPGITVSRARCASGYETVGVEATLHVKTNVALSDFASCGTRLIGAKLFRRVHRLCCVSFHTHIMPMDSAFFK